MAKPKPKRKPDPAEPKPLLTQSQIAKEFRRDRRTVEKLLEHVEPAGMAGRWRLYRREDVAPLMVVNLRGVKSELRDELIREQVRKLKLANDEKEEALIPRSEVCRVHAEILSRVRRLLEQKLINEYPSEVADLGVSRVRGYGRNLCDALMEEINKMGAMWKH